MEFAGKKAVWLAFDAGLGNRELAWDQVGVWGLGWVWGLIIEEDGGRLKLKLALG